MTVALPFDRVVVLESGKRVRMSASDFMRLPLPKKIEHILARSIEFYSGEATVDRRAALASLRETRAL